MKSKAKKSSSNPSEKKKTTIPYHRKPDNLSLDEWQILLRKQFAGLQEFKITNIGGESVFSDYTVFNPLTSNTYKVSIRSNAEEISKGKNYNFCECYDFKTNGLGTCKHIEAVFAQIESKKSLNSILEKGNFQHVYSSIYLEYGQEGRKVKLRIGWEESRKIQILSKQYFSENGTIKSTTYEKFEEFFLAVKKFNPTFRCYSDALAYIFEVRAKNRRKTWIWKNQKALQNELLSKYIKAELHPYQKEGVCFAVQAGRALIADEMGLGKTIQALAAAEVLKKEFGIQKVLVVCPTSLKYQWKSEIEKFTDSTSNVIEGLKTKREVQYADDRIFYKIVGHHTVGNDLDFINSNEFDLIILDEAQRIKNWKAKISQNIKKLKSEYAIVLTGTPLENKLEELYSVIQVINPFRLGALYRFLSHHQITDPETGKVIGYKDLNQVGKILSDILIRRTKKTVLLQLPSRQDKNLFVTMTAEQRDIHNECYDLVCRLVNRWRRLGFLPEKDRQRLMINLNKMRMVCNSTFILDQQSRHDTKISELMGILEEIFQMDGEKVVIFSQWERMTRLVARELDDLGVKYENLHGGIHSKDRKSLLDNFQKDPECKVFLSTDAGGVGLNLQSASYLINLDIPWNPAVLEQRIARIYRIGQKKKVNIINLITIDSIEHRMLDVLKFKSSMAEGVLDAGDDSILMQEDRFKQFMNSVETMVDEDQSFTESESVDIDYEEKTEDIYLPEPKPTEKESDQKMQLDLFDKDVPDEPSSNPEPKASNETIPAGTEWISQLAKVFGDPKQTEAMVKSLTEKDSKTGQTYLKLPVENEEVVHNVLKGIGQLFQAIDWSKFGK